MSPPSPDDLFSSDPDADRASSPLASTADDSPASSPPSSSSSPPPSSSRASSSPSSSSSSSSASPAQLPDACIAPANTSTIALSTGEDLPDDPYPQTPDGEQPGLFDISDDGFNFIVAREKLVNSLYNDPDGHCTVGIGHLVHLGNCNGAPSEAPFKNGLSDDEAKALFRQDLERYTTAVSNGITSRINQYQYDALVSFCFNIGTGGFASSGALRMVNAKKWSKVPDEMMKWNKPADIIGRRRLEANLFRTGKY